MDNIVDSNNQFALDLYSKYKIKDENIFFSPYSLTSALSMTYEGAKGTTAEEMQKVLHLPSDINKVRNDYLNIYNKLNIEDKPYKLFVANALWAQKDYTFSKDYFDNVEKYYNGKVTNLDFKTDTENSRLTINNWVENKTNDKIKDLIPKGILTQDTKLVLTNTIYFKANWTLPFDPGTTNDQDFNLNSGNKIKVKTMHQTANYNYMENDELQMLEMPYQGNDISMIVILPKQGRFDDVENYLTSDNIAGWKNSMQDQEVDVAFPKFKFETKYLMKQDLINMGMPTAFTDVADFSGMTGKTDLKISEVIHQAFINVSESGTEAAAATAVIMAPTAVFNPVDKPKPKEFIAEHPFIFIIQQKDTGNILFMGKVNNPSN